MATSSFKRKKYGMVKPIKVRKVKVKRPDARELARYYKAIATYGIWQQLDNVCYAMQWWESALSWFYVVTEKEDITTTQARKIASALYQRKAGLAAKTDKGKIDFFYRAILVFEELAKLAGLKVPAFKKYVDAGEKQAKKHKVILEKMEPRFARITGLLGQMFPSFTMTITPVPQITDPVTGKDIGRKIDHTKNAIFYSRKMLKAITHKLRHEGYLAVAIEEAWWLSRAMSFDSHANPTRHLSKYELLLENFNTWARRKDTPSKLAKKPSKPKKLKKEDIELAEIGEDIQRQQDEAIYFEALDERVVQ